MSDKTRGRQFEKEQQQPAIQPPIANDAAKHAVPNNVPSYRQCPHCWGRHRGAGVAYATRGRKRYYKCAVCGHNWLAVVSHETVHVEYRNVDLHERQSQ